MIVSDSLADLQRKFDAWKSGMEDKGLRVNVGKTKLMVSGQNVNPIYDSGKHPFTHAGYADKEFVATQYFVGAASIGCTGVVQANQEEPGMTLHLSVRDVWEMIEPSTYSQVIRSMLMGSRWSLLTPAAIWVTCFVLVVAASLQ